MAKRIQSRSEELGLFIKQLERDINNTQEKLDSVTEPLLIDGFVFELKALNSRYSYYLNELKEIGYDRAI